MTRPPVKLLEALNISVGTYETFLAGIYCASVLCHDRAIRSGWWNDIETNESIIGKRNRAEMMMLMVSEIAEAMEGYRKNLMDDKLPTRKMEEVELADLLIRVFDYARAHDLDLGGAMIEKLEYNATRPDHKPENRLLANGKKF